MSPPYRFALTDFAAQSAAVGFLQLLSCLVGGTSCASIGSETRTDTHEMLIGCISGCCSFQDLWVPLLLWLPISHTDSVDQIYGIQCFPCPRAVVRNLFCSYAISYDIGSRILAQSTFFNFFFFLKIEIAKKNPFLLGGTIFNFLNFLTSILKGEAVRRRQILV